jgi:hypothetical protein
VTRRTILGAGAALLVKAEPRPLFNGRDLTGWTPHGHGRWAVEDGAITGRFDASRPGPGYLLTDEEFSDFRLTLEFWITKGGNSGIYVRQPHRTFGTRGREKPAQLPTDGHEVQINYNEKKNLTGAIYNLSNVTKLAGGEERWNRCAIECRGPRIAVWIDGEEVNRFEPLRSARGAIGFQVHGQTPHQDAAKFRNVAIELI